MSIEQLQNNPKPSLDDIYSYVMGQEVSAKPASVQKEKINIPTYPQVAETNDNEDQGFLYSLASGIRKVRTSVSDAALGIGHSFSRLQESLRFQKIAPRLRVIQTGLGRAFGSAVTLATGAYRTVTNAMDDIKNGNMSLPTARKEITLTLGAAGAGALVGEAGYLAIAGALSLGAPAAVVTGLGAATVIGAGYAAYKARDVLEGYYDQIINRYG